MAKDPINDMLSEGDPNAGAPSKTNRETIIVTGSSGFIGYALCDLLAGTYNVIGFDHPGGGDPPPSADKIEVDISKDDDVRNAFKKVRERYGDTIASVIHLAAYYDFSGKPSTKYEEITVQGTARLLQSLKTFRVEQFVFSSTMLIYEPCQPGQTINENSPINPEWDYPKSKVTTENLIRRERGNMPAVFARISGVYDDQCHSIPLANQIQRINERQLTSHLFPGDTSHGQSFMHRDDLVSFFVNLIAKRKQLPDESVFVIGEPEVLSYQTLQNEFGRLIHGQEWKTIWIPKWFAKFGAWLQGLVPFFGDPFIRPWMIDLADEHYALNISLAEKQLGWKPAHSLRAALSPMIAALKKDPVAWYKENKLRKS